LGRSKSLDYELRINWIVLVKDMGQDTTLDRIRLGDRISYTILVQLLGNRIRIRDKYVH